MPVLHFKEEKIVLLLPYFLCIWCRTFTFVAELTWVTQSSPPSDSWWGATKMSCFCWHHFVFHTVHSALIFITVAPCIVYLLDWHGTTALSKIPIIYFSVRVWQIYWRIWQVPSVVISYVYVYIYICVYCNLCYLCKWVNIIMCMYRSDNPKCVCVRKEHLLMKIHCVLLIDFFLLEDRKSVV